jgi:signal peptidase
LKIVKKILSFIPAILFALGLTLIIYIGYSAQRGTYPKIFGYSFMVIVTDSMEPTYNIGDFITVKTQNDYEVGDVVTFYYDISGDTKPDLVSHRIESIIDGEVTLIGDNPDYEGQTQTITKEDILGKVVWKSAFIGSLFANNILQNKQFLFAIITIILLIFVIYQIIHMIKIAKTKDSD